MSSEPNECHADRILNQRSYEESDFLASSVALHAAFGFQNGDGVVLIVSPEHMSLLEFKLGALIADVSERKACGQLLVLDAVQLMNQLMVDGMPSRERCFRMICGLLDEMHTRFAHIRVFGEIVDMLLSKVVVLLLPLVPVFSLLCVLASAT